MRPDSADPASLARMIDRFQGRRILVVGDVMLDHFVVGAVTRISPEAPVPIVEHALDEYRLGGGANVEHNLRALGARVAIAGVVGRDEAGVRIANDLDAIGIDTEGLVTDEGRPSTRKLRIVTARNQQVARVDYEWDIDAPVDLERRLAEAIVDQLPRCDVVIVSDYLKGVITSGIGATLAAEAARRGIPWLVDPKIPHIDLYRGATLVTPNHHEAEVAAAMRVRTDEEAGEAARRIRDRAGCPWITPSDETTAAVVARARDRSLYAPQATASGVARAEGACRRIGPARWVAS